ncbi:hypothetical protein DAPPUDRAFT_330714 [Daphnia pulex]|uniref:Uncharacterized protein n=1 Tax=Daphnia pulex TaxID=6669 RepID=E9HKE9_DAPPU|nr:hypothetical protein DAPPUDRAFT_330714 [Daphnia pulex]|eukprot:EFX67795.1 hypothetical protein DAPPUDRAFT_330714 [Daphnia pulex]
MAEPRKSRVDQIFGSTVKHGDEPKTVRKSKWKEQPVSRAKAAASKEIPKPKFPIHESSNNAKSSLKKPPFVVPGKIVYNDLHLLQSITQVKCPPAKKTVTRTGVGKVTPIQQQVTSRQASGLAPEHSVPSHPTHLVDDFAASSSSRLSTHNPFIAVDRRTSVQKPFSSLLNTQELSAPQLSDFQEDGSDIDSSEDSDGEQPLDNRRGNNQGVTEEIAESKLEKSDTSTQEEHHEIIELAIVHRNNEDTNNITLEFTESGTESPSKTQIEESPLQQSLHAKNNMEVAQQLQVQEVHQTKEDTSMSNSEVNEPTVQIASPNKAELEEDQLQQSTHGKNMEIARQLRAQVDEKKTQLDELCRLWNDRLKQDNAIPDDETGAVLTVIGQTQQLQRERFHQYAGLILKFENNSDEKKITKTDLEGFWETILLQVTDVENKFTELDCLHRDGWTRQETVHFQLKKTKKPKKKTEKKKNIGEVEVKSSGIRSHIASLRKKHMESNSLKTDDFVSYADQSSLLNPREVASASSLNLTDKTCQMGQSAIEQIRDEEFSAPSGIQAETPFYSKLKRRMKHKSENHAFFSSPHQSPCHTDSPRPRSHSTNVILDHPLVPTSLAKREKVLPPSQFLEIPKIFSPSVQTRSGRIIKSPDRYGQIEELRIHPHINISESPSTRVQSTRSGRISHSPNRFGQTEEAMVSSYTPKSRITQYIKPQQQNAEINSLTPERVGDIPINKEENNNDVNEGFSATHFG